MEEGIQKATVLECRFGESPAKKTPRLEVNFQLENNESIWGHIYFGHKGMARKSIKALGFDIDNKDLEELRNNNHLLTGRECEVELEDDPQYGMKVKWINKIGGDGDLDLTKLTKDLRDAKKKGKDKKEDFSPEVEGEAEKLPF